jgi:hypothetical protein
VAESADPEPARDQLFPPKLRADTPLAVHLPGDQVVEGERLVSATEFTSVCLWGSHYTASYCRRVSLANGVAETSPGVPGTGSPSSI